MLPVGSSKAAHEANPNAPGYPAGAGSAGDDRSLGCAGRARGPLSAADASALAASPLAEDTLGTRSRVGCLHAPPRLPGCPSLRDHFVAALARQAWLARRGRAAASPCPGAQGVRLGTAVHEPRAALSACACRWQRRRGADRCRPSRPLRRCDADRGRAPLPRLSCRSAGNQPLACHARSDRQRRAGAARRRRRRLPGSRGRCACRARSRSRSRDRSRRGDRGPATPGRKRTRPALPARPLVEPAHDLAVPRDASVGVRPRLLARPRGGLLHPARHARTGLLVPTRAAVSLRRCRGRGAAGRASGRSHSGRRRNRRARRRGCRDIAGACGLRLRGRPGSLLRSSRPALRRCVAQPDGCCCPLGTAA